MPTPPMTENEIISYLTKTSLPSIIVEGEDDASIYRWLEDKLGTFAGNILICSGRGTLLRLFRQRDAFAGKRIAWLADKDMWVFTSPPTDTHGVIFTSGYSIENDLYAGSTIESLLDGSEQTSFNQLISLAAKWFAFEVQEHNAGRDPILSTHVRHFADINNMQLNPDYISSRGYSDPDPILVNIIHANYITHLRGKTLMMAIVNYLSHPRRTSKYSYSNVIEMCLKLHPVNPYIGRLVTEATLALNK